MSDLYLPGGIVAAEICPRCKMGMHSLCTYALDGFFLYDLANGACCCRLEYSVPMHMHAVERDLSMLIRNTFYPDDDEGEKPPKRKATGELEQGADLLPPKRRGDSGYIHPDAWPSARDLESFIGVENAQSTGYKRATKMYKSLYGKRCEWAGLLLAGGGVQPIPGCMGNEATDLHHGPDKNTFNNAKMSVGIGDTENVHLICSWCHNGWHAANDQFYGEYDRSTDMVRPHTPTVEYAQHDPETKADLAILVEIEKQRRESGRNGRQRNPDLIEFGIDDD